jgi:DNA replication ATP-dependent helicase Dna2
MSHAPLLSELRAFIADEQTANHHKRLSVWRQPLLEKLDKGWSQGFLGLERGEEPSTIWATLGAGESRFREGDLLFLHSGSPLSEHLGGGLTLETEDDGRWLLRGNSVAMLLGVYAGGPCYADPDSIDLTPYFERALEEIASSQIGLSVVLPLLAGTLEMTFDDRDAEQGEHSALSEGFNAQQAQAVGLAFGAEQLACIQGPPGTGKTRVLGLIARLMVQRGERVLVTSHTHTAINNALNKIHAQGVPTVKIGRTTQRKGLDDGVACVPQFGDWKDRPTNGYVIGATPFARASGLFLSATKISSRP